MSIYALKTSQKAGLTVKRLNGQGNARINPEADLALGWFRSPQKKKNENA
jgi:hypothetical protein